MLRQFLFLTFVCIFYAASNAQKLQENNTKNHVANKTSLGHSMIVTLAMISCLSSVLIILIPTSLYYKYCARTSDTEMGTNAIH